MSLSESVHYATYRHPRSDDEDDEDAPTKGGHKRKRGVAPAEDEFFRYDDMEKFLQNAEKQRDAEDDEDEDAERDSDEEDDDDSGEQLLLSPKGLDAVQCFAHTLDYTLGMQPRANSDTISRN